MTGGRQTRELNAGGLGDEWNGPRSAGIDLQDVDHAVLDRVLHIDETDDAEPKGKVPGELAHLIHLAVGDQIRREHAGRVAGVNPRVFDVLHDAADDALGAIGDGVHIGFERIFQETIDQHRMARGNAHRRGEIIGQQGRVVDDPHSPPTQNVGWPNQDRDSQCAPPPRAPP